MFYFEDNKSSSHSSIKSSFIIENPRDQGTHKKDRKDTEEALLDTPLPNISTEDTIYKLNDKSLNYSIDKFSVHMESMKPKVDLPIYQGIVYIKVNNTEGFFEIFSSQKDYIENTIGILVKFNKLQYPRKFLIALR